MIKDKVLILGGSHLAYRVGKLVSAKKLKPIMASVDSFFSDQGPMFDDIQDFVSNFPLNEIAMVYIIDDRDDRNLGLALAIMSVNDQVPMTIALFNEGVASHLRASHPSIAILNPAKIAAPKFVELLNTTLDRSVRYRIDNQILELLKKPLFQGDRLILLLTGLFVMVIISCIVYFSLVEGWTVIDSAYFVVVTIATVGYGDINLLNTGIGTKLVGIGLILSSMIFVWSIFSLTTDRLIKMRSEYALGRKKYHLKNHVIVCGLGRLGYFVVEELLKRNEQVVIIESSVESANIDHYRNMGIPVYVGNARLPRVLQDASVNSAKAVISVINNDYNNLEIGLSARSINPSIRLILRIFDDTMAQNIKEHLDIHLAYSMSALADDSFIATLSNKMNQ